MKVVLSYQRNSLIVNIFVNFQNVYPVQYAIVRLEEIRTIVFYTYIFT